MKTNDGWPVICSLDEQQCQQECEHKDIKNREGCPFVSALPYKKEFHEYFKKYYPHLIPSNETRDNFNSKTESMKVLIIAIVILVVLSFKTSTRIWYCYGIRGGVPWVCTVKAASKDEAEAIFIKFLTNPGKGETIKMKPIPKPSKTTNTSKSVWVQSVESLLIN